MDSVGIKLYRKPEVVIYTRHKPTCPQAENESSARCECAKWLRYSLEGKQHKVPAGTRSWTVAEEKREELQKRLTSGRTVDGQVTKAAQQEQQRQRSIEQAIKVFVAKKEGDGFLKATIRKLERQLQVFESFLAARSKFFPHEITDDDIIVYRNSRSEWKSGLMKQKAHQNLRSFLKFVKADPDAIAALKPIKLTRVDIERTEPKPFSEDELTRLLAQVPKTFPDATKAARVTALIHLQVSTGLAIRDAVTLERKNIEGGRLSIRRQKTNKTVDQRLDIGLYQELTRVLNGNPRYIFWSGEGIATSATTNWQHDLRELMTDAKVWIKGNLSHRFRDTAVDFWLGSGYSMTEVAAALGDTVAIAEKHYARLASKRMSDRMARLPVRTWQM